MPGIVRISNKKQLIEFIEAVEDEGGDASLFRRELEGMKAQPKTIQSGIEVQEKIKELKQQASITQGRCVICDEEGKLYSGTCEGCFNSWGTEVIKKEGET